MSRRLAAFAAALLAGASFAHAKDSVTIGMALEPPGLDPTAEPAAAIGEITHYNIFEGLTKINEDFSVTPLLAESWTFSPDLKTLTLNAEAGRQIPGRRAVHVEGREVLVRALRRQGFDQQGQGVLRLDRVDRRAAIPAKVVLTFKEPSFAALFHLGYQHRGHPRREERGDRGDQSRRHRALQARQLEQGRRR